MVSGNQGNHVPHESCLPVDGGKPAQPANRPIIFHGLLAYMHSLVMQKDKLYVQNIILDAFGYIHIREAREVLFKCLSKDRYVYQGPRGNTSDRNKQVHAFDGLYDKMIMMKRDDSVDVPIFAIPSDQLSSILDLALKVNHAPCEARFNHLETDFKDMKKTFQDVANMMMSPQDAVPPRITVQASPASAIPMEIRSRLSSTGSLKRKSVSEDAADTTADFESCESDGDAFELPAAQRRKIARIAKKNASSPKPKSGDSYRARVENNRVQAGNNRVQAGNNRVQGGNNRAQGGNKKDWRKGMVWGKNNSQPGSSFGAKVPEIFISHCDSGATEDAVKQYLLKEHINITNVRQASHERAWYKSFVVTVAKKEDYDKMLTGAHVPQDVGVKRYYTPRSASGVRSSGEMTSWYKSTYKPLDELELPEVAALPLESAAQLQMDDSPSASQMTDDEQTARSMATALDMPADADSRKPNDP